ncbi:unnamed protein product [Cylindrotheca closterium]|uniref:Protein kinase domain-containing protein n=1 Tax=Cylindrotheca closterium TaxID=2856 RepID=A0AAD2FY15_9STRA|nr:unnamed protein product [Cylindrotheca closterium]
MEEGIQNAKKFQKVVLEEVDDIISEEQESDVYLPSLNSDEDEDDDEEEDSLWGVATSGFEKDESHDIANSGIEDSGNKDSSRRRRKRRRKRHSTKNDRPSEKSSPSMAPTSLPPTTENQDQSGDDDIDSPFSSATSNTIDPSLIVGKTILDNNFYISNQVRVGSTKSELYHCYPVTSSSHLEEKYQKHPPFMIKLSQNVEQMILEYRIHKDLYSRLSPEQQDLFIMVYDWIPASDITHQRVGFLMEAGLENLRGIVWKHGPMQGQTLKEAMMSIILTIQVLHQLGTIWTEVKAENFVVMRDGKIKAIDLESVTAHGEFLRCYTAETYPPEFPPDSLYNEIPQVPLDYSFDIWGLGLVLLEMAIGEPLFTLHHTYDVDYVRERLKDPQGIVNQARQRLEHIDYQARDVILQCLVVEPTKRSTCEQLLNHEYFQN